MNQISPQRFLQLQQPYAFYSALWPMGDTDADAEQLQKMLAEEVRSADPGDPVQSAIKRTFERDQTSMPEKVDDQSYRYE